jgi:lipopolysaccharide transport system ATP-binding protein
MFTIKAMCDRVIYLSSGRIAYDGTADDGIAHYEKDCRLGIAPWAQPLIGSDPTQRPIRVTDILTLDDAGAPRTVFEFGERMRVRVTFDAPKPLARPNFVVCFLRSDGVACCNYSTAADGVVIPAVGGQGAVEVLTPPIKLVSENYSVQVLVWDEKFLKLHCAQTGPSFHVRHDLYSTHFGVFHENGEWSPDGFKCDRKGSSVPARH